VVTTANRLLRFAIDTPGTIESTVPVTGLPSGGRVASIAFQPFPGALDVLVRSAAGDRLATLDTSSGAPCLVGAAPSPALSGAGARLEFEGADLRLLGNGGQNLLVDPAHRRRRRPRHAARIRRRRSGRRQGAARRRRGGRRLAGADVRARREARRPRAARLAARGRAPEHASTRSRPEARRRPPTSATTARWTSPPTARGTPARSRPAGTCRPRRGTCARPCPASPTSAPDASNSGGPRRAHAGWGPVGALGVARPSPGALG